MDGREYDMREATTTGEIFLDVLLLVSVLLMVPVHLLYRPAARHVVPHVTLLLTA